MSRDEAAMGRRKSARTPEDPGYTRALARRGQTTGILTEELRRMIDAGDPRLGRMGQCSTDPFESMQLQRRRDEKAWHDGSEEGVFRHVLRIFLVMIVRPMIVIGLMIFLMHSRLSRVVMMNHETP